MSRNNVSASKDIERIFSSTESAFSGHGQLHHRVPKFNERSSLFRTVNIRNVLQTEIDQLLVFFLTQPSNEALARQLLPQSIRRQAVLRKAEVEKTDDRYGGRSKLFLLFDKVGATNEAYSAFMTKGGQDLEHLRSDSPAGRGEGVIDIE